MNVGIVGERHSFLTLVENIEARASDGRTLAVWRCDCGALKTASITRVRSGSIRSCGHLSKEIKPGLKHGMRNTKEYGAWSGAKDRCNNKNSKDYARYGGSGIKFHSEWQDDFQSFYEHIGRCLSKDHQIDRIDSTKGYEPGNVRWATRKMQARNRRSACNWSIKGLSFETAKEAAEHFGVSVQTVWRWTRGSRDERRDTTTPKREDCNATPRY